jgi:ParB family chromosome partitioning protein
MTKPQEKKTGEKRDRDVVRLEEELSDRLGAAVKIAANQKGSGRITIEFASLDQLDGLLRRIK